MDITTRFWSKVDRNGPVYPGRGRCWVWIASKDFNGYGQFGMGGAAGRPMKAHRVAFFLEEGRWPEPFALHHCDNPSCVRRSHLFEGDQKDNMRDASAKGRTRGYQKGRVSPTKIEYRLRELIRETYSLGVKQTDIAKALGISQSAVSSIVREGR
jgi:hypothetical protein